MEERVENPNNENLQELSYSELKKIAKKHGIKGNMKAQKIIAAINSLNCSANETFSTPELKEMNSSKKNKEAKFDVDQATPLATPKRGTYSLETPSSLKADEISLAVNDTSLLDMSNVTISRGSERKLRSRKVSFMSPVLAPSTPKNSNLRLRPKTPVASRASVGKRVSFSTPGSRRKKSTEKTFPTTPLPKLSFSEENSALSSRASGKGATTPLPSIEEVSNKDETTDPIKVTANAASENFLQKDDDQLECMQTVVSKKEVSAENKETAKTESMETVVSKKEDSAENKETAKPESMETVVSKKEVSAENKETAKPEYMETVVSKKEIAAKNKKTAIPGPVKPKSTPKKGRVTKIKQAATPMLSTNPAFSEEVSNFLGGITTLDIDAIVNAANNTLGGASVKSFSSKRKTPIKNKQAVTSGSTTKTLVLKNDTTSKLKQVTTPSSTTRVVLKNDTASKLKRTATPNFKKIHEKMFDKMEAIDDYQKRKVLNSAKKIGLHSDMKSKVTKAKSKIPSFSGIPFVPSLSSSRIIGPSQNDKKPKVVLGSVKASENAPKRSKSKFDLKASLSRKLGYKPYKGALKPLADSNLNISTATSVSNAQERVNKVVATKRMETRSLIRGVRTNKRFELQMKNRKLD